MKADGCKELVTHPKVIEEAINDLLSNEEYDYMSMLFKMVSDSTRLKIINALFDRELCVCDLMAVTQMSQSAISHQLSKLKQTRLVKSEKRGKNVFYSLSDDHVRQIFKQAQEHARE
ncbi:MAG: transcriptional regulator [Firmicutes bacterium HGW-Firmicutes-20]|jgi:ArsR family transcriptional regulator|nr:MAG: transcriptional regulator [Firmicutes bacterium HGW-Firmicutes-20]PKM69324.1 MAG: transcriptional regulator [Firmicutes bacterium HGW-Firmicutes-19]